MQLVISTPGTFITQKDECFRLKQQERTFDISPSKVGSLVVTNQAIISTQAVALALEHNIDVIFMDDHGAPIGLVWFSKMGSAAMVRRRQLEAATGPLGMQLIIDMLERKVENQAGFLKKLMHSRPGKEDLFTAAIDRIRASREDIATCPTRNLNEVRHRLMKLEGAAGREYFQCLSKIMSEKYYFQGRSQKPAKDPFNACLNYCYGILYSLVEKTCILAGLDPYIGLLHTDNYNKKSLIFDLIEPFRIMSEQTVVYLFTGKKMKDEHFDLKGNSVSLSQKGKSVVIEAMNSHLDETVRYRTQTVKRRHIIQHEGHRLANILLGNTGQMKPDWLDIKEI